MKTSALSLAAALASAFAVAGTARGAIVAVDYSVSVAALAEETFDPYSYNDMDTSYAAGFVMYTGEPFTARFTYDDAAPLQAGPGGYFGVAASHVITFGQSGTTIVFDNSLLGTARTDAADGISLAGGGYIQNTGDPYISMSLSLLAPAGTHAPAALPTLADWQHYAAAPANTFRMVINASGTNVYVSGAGISLQVSAVPEPASAVMTLAGQAIVAAAARRRTTLRA